MNNTGMELPGAPFLYTMGILGMTFIGFSAIVMLLRQTLGRKLRPFDALFAHVYMEFGLVVSVGAMLPPLFALWNLSLLDVWRLSSALVGIPLLFLGVTYPARRRSASGEHTPFYVRVNVSIVILISVALLLTALGIFHEKSPAMFTSALTGFLTFAVAAWLQALNLILLRKAPLWVKSRHLQCIKPCQLYSQKRTH